MLVIYYIATKKVRNIMLECNHVMKKYLSVTAVEDITLRLEPGLTYALLGPNGSGKTTFMKGCRINQTDFRNDSV